MAAKHPKHFIQKMDLDKGGLHRALHVPEGKDIPQSKLDAALHSKDPHVRHMAQMAVNFSHMHHGKKKGK